MSKGALWIKISTDMFNDEAIALIESHPSGSDILVIWFKILCLAGTSAGDGILVFKEHIPYTDEMLATIFRKPVQDVRMAMEVLTQFGLVERVEGTYLIPQWDKYQGSEKLDRIREQNAARQRRFKERQRQKLLGESAGEDAGNVTDNVTVTAKSRIQNKSKSKNKSNKEHTSKSDAFDEVWAKYPRKQGKQAAFKAYEKALNDGISQAEILNGVERYAEWCSATGQDKRYIKHGSTWFNQRCWDDELPDPSEYEKHTRGILADAPPEEGGGGWLNEVDLSDWGML